MLFISLTRSKRVLRQFNETLTHEEAETVPDPAPLLGPDPPGAPELLLTGRFTSDRPPSRRFAPQLKS